MKKSYRVFTGAPSVSTIQGKEPRELVWQSFPSPSRTPTSLPIPAATLEQAERRISLVYQNVIFANDDGDDQFEDDDEISRSRFDNEVTKSYLMDASAIAGQNSVACTSGFQETFFTDQSGEGEETMLSDTSSIGRFPTFSFGLNILTALSSLTRRDRGGGVNFNLLLGVLEVDGPSYVKPKTSVAHKDSEMALLKLVAGDESGTVCKIIAWRDTAEVWSGVREEPTLKRGDIVLFQNVVLPGTPKGATGDNEAIQFTASPAYKSQAQICYRTLPYSDGDPRFRPDLRLGYSVPAVRKVAEVVQWMERMAGIFAADF